MNSKRDTLKHLNGALLEECLEAPFGSDFDEAIKILLEEF